MRLLQAIVVLLVIARASQARGAIILNPNPADFGGVLVATMATLEVTLSSSSGLEFVDVEIANCTGAAGGPVTVSPISVALNPVATLTLTFTPTGSGSRSCTLRVYEKNTTNLLGAFSVIGRGETPANLSVTVAGSAPPDPISFGAVRYRDGAVAGSTLAKTIRVTNTGDRTLSITNVTATGEYTFTGGTSQMISGGASRDWVVTFNPTAAGTRTGAMTFTSNGGNRTLNLSGSGTTATVNVTPATNDLGVVAIGSSRSADITITNTATANKGVLGVTYVNLANNTNSWFTVCSTQTTSCTFAPALQVSTSTVASVRCTPPAAASGTRTVTVTFGTDADNVTATTVNVTCTAGASAVASSMPSVDFGRALLGAPAMRTFMVTNGANQPMNLTYSRTGTYAAQFAAVGPSTLAAGASGTVTVTYSPTLEGAVSADLDVQVRNGTTNALEPGPSLVLDGRGAEKHIKVTNVVAFPDTYRGSPLTVPELVSITNTGEWPLTISDVTTSQPEVWALQNITVPFDVPALTTYDIPVLFSPVEAGKAPDGILTIQSNAAELADRMAQVLLVGNGKERRISVTPGQIDFGDVAVGSTGRLSALQPDLLLLLTNTDEVGFQLRDARVSDEFAITDETGAALTGTDLVPGVVRRLDLAFSPNVADEVAGILQLYFDSDLVPHSTAVIRARGVAVDAHGGGGCSTSRGASAGLAVALALLVLRRRRRQ